jgi:transcriptional regulator with XRE-family HTH domain
MVRTAFKAAIVARNLSQRQLSRLSNITENRISEGLNPPTHFYRGV